MLLILAAAFVSAGFVPMPPGEEIGAMSAVAIGQGGRVFVLHRGPKPLLALSSDGKFIGSWGEGLFEVPHGLRVAPDGTVWTTDNKNNKLRQFSPDGRLLRTIESDFKAPDDLVFASTGEIVVADAGNARLVKLTPEGKRLASWGAKGDKPGEFAAAHGLAIDARDRIYVADRGNNRVQAFDLSGKHLASWTGFGNPFGLLAVGRELLVSDGDAHRITHLSLSSGQVTAQWGDAQTLQLPHLMALDSKGRLYVAEVNGRRVQIFKRR